MQSLSSLLCCTCPIDKWIHKESEVICEKFCNTQNYVKLKRIKNISLVLRSPALIIPEIQTWIKDPQYHVFKFNQLRRGLTGMEGDLYCTTIFFMLTAWERKIMWLHTVHIYQYIQKKELQEKILRGFWHWPAKYDVSLFYCTLYM